MPTLGPVTGQTALIINEVKIHPELSFFALLKSNYLMKYK